MAQESGMTILHRNYSGIHLVWDAICLLRPISPILSMAEHSQIHFTTGFLLRKHFLREILFVPVFISSTISKTMDVPAAQMIPIPAGHSTFLPAIVSN